MSHAELLAWAPEERAKVHMWMLEKLLVCDGCGTRLEEWDKERGGERQAYIAETFVCPGCAMVGDAIDAANTNAKVYGKSNQVGLRARLLPKWLVDYRVANRTPEERERMRGRERERVEMERAGGADMGGRGVVREIKGLGGGRRPPIGSQDSAPSIDENES